MPDRAHLLIAYAASDSAGCRQALQELALPHLEQLLARLTPLPDEAVTGSEHSLSPPHERALAQALGLPGADGRIPWAAWQRRQQGLPDGDLAWAFVTPCEWRVGSDHVTLCDPDAQGLGDAESRALLDIVAPWFAHDGIALHYEQPTRWLASGALFADLATASLDRALLRDLRHWLPAVGAARSLHRLHSELQMLLHTHAFNDARAQRNLPPVNAFWLHGAGALPAPVIAPVIAPATLPTVAYDLRQAALRSDWQAWRAQWLALDAGPVAALLRQAHKGQALRMTLSGERNALSWHSAPRAWAQRARRFFQLRPGLIELCDKL